MKKQKHCDVKCKKKVMKKLFKPVNPGREGVSKVAESYEKYMRKV